MYFIYREQLRCHNSEMFIGTASWSIPRDFSKPFPSEGSHLERYSQILNAVEINSSFYKEHRAKTFERWAKAVPESFKFSVKLSKIFTHESALKPNAKELLLCLDNYFNLGSKLDVLLMQFPGKMEFDLKKMERFYKIIRKNYQGHIVIEPRNLSWISEDSQKLMLDYQISKVIADPERVSGGSKKILHASGITYYRLHGSPIIYRSSYTKKFLKELSLEIKRPNNTWCIFDNTTLGFGIKNALELQKLI